MIACDIISSALGSLSLSLSLLHSQAFPGEFSFLNKEAYIIIIIYAAIERVEVQNNSRKQSLNVIR
jgi:hypothetical protein